MVTMTASERRARAKAEFDAYMETCPTSRLMAVLGNKWTTMLLNRLAENGTMRHAELARSAPGISAKMLTQSLRALERDGLVTRHVMHTVPVQVDYTLTVLGESLIPIVATVRAWAERHMPEVEDARDRYDSGRAEETAPGRAGEVTPERAGEAVPGRAGQALPAPARSLG